jgi:hypothetical protein
MSKREFDREGEQREWSAQENARRAGLAFALARKR